MPGDVIVRDPAGRAYTVSADELPGYLQNGFSVESSPEHADRLVQEDTEARYGGPGGAIAAGLLSGLGTVTLGASDAAIAAAGDAQALRKYHELHPVASTIGSVAGALVPTGVASVAGKVGGAIRAGEEAGAIARLSRGALAGAAEGAVYGAGQGVSELAMDRDPLTMERAGSVLSSNILFGGAIGGATGLAGGALEGVLGRTQRAIDRKLGAAAAGRTAEDVAAAEPDLADLDVKGLKQAHAAETDAIEKAREPDRAAFVDNLKEAKLDTEEEGPWKVTSGSPNRVLRQYGAAARRADTSLRKALDNMESLRARPERVLDALQTRGQAYESMLESAQNELANYQREFEQAPDKIRRDILNPTATTWQDSGGFMVPRSSPKEEIGPFTPAGVEAAVDREMKRRYGPDLSDPQFPKRFDLIPAVQSTVEQNQALREQLAQITAKPTSDRLRKIEDAIDALEAAKAAPKSSLGTKLLHLVPGGHAISELADIGKEAVTSLRSATGKVARKTAETASALISGARVAVDKATPIATKVLAETSFGPAVAQDAPRLARRAGSSEELAALFRQRTDEIKAQTAYDATGVPRIRPQARQAIAARLAPIAWHDPIIADRLETLAVRRLEYLSSIIPRRPDLGGIPTGGADAWKPSDMEMRAWARAVAAIEDPGGVERRILAGTLTPEDVTAYWAVYPERGRHFQESVLTELPQRGKALPYAQRVALGMFVGQPLDPSLHPQVLGVLQSQFTDEPGTNGGTQAPKAMPQFGSIKKSVDNPTPAQARAQGAQAL